MPVNILTLNLLLGWGTVMLQILTVVLFALFLYREEYTHRFIARSAVWIAFFLSLGASILTLIYSEVYGVTPCGLCWFERVFLYPQVVILLVALIRRDCVVACYSIALSLCGAAISLYHHALQMGMTSPLPCPASGNVDCAKRIIFEFGYVTFPLMAFSLFVFLIVIMLFYRREHVTLKAIQKQ